MNEKRIYGAWAGDTKGRVEDESRCIEEVKAQEGWGHWYQCQRKRGHGPNELYCKQHAKMLAEKTRNE